MDEKKKVLIDYVEPFDGEFLFGWIIRLLRFHSDNLKLGCGSSTSMQRLFGERVVFPGLNFQNGLEHLLDTFDFEKSATLSSIKSILDNMTVLPFYTAFMEPDEIEAIYGKIGKLLIYRSYEELVAIRQNKKLIESRPHIKVCPQCIEQDPYLKREHQVSGNFICEKHKTVLCYMEYIPRWNKIDYFEHYNQMVPYSLKDEEIEVAIRISEMVHRIFDEGFLLPISELKHRLRGKLKELGFLNDEYLFYDYKDFLQKFGNDIYFEQISKRDAIMRALCDVKNAVNPIYYLLMIDFLFGGLDELYSYHNNDEQFWSSTGCEYSVLKDLNFHSIEYYSETASDEYLREYEIVGDTKNEIIVKHRKCGHYFLNTKRSTSLDKCRKCFTKKQVIKGTEQEKIRELQDYKYPHYISVKEYAHKYNKDEQQIRDYCTAGRIPGAIKAGNAWLLPEDAEYPLDRRYLKNR